MQKTNGKYFYTAKIMNQALLQLLEKKDIEFISITEITKKAGVSRSTFYLHYDDVYELFEETIENLNKDFELALFKDTRVNFNSKQENFLITPKYLIPYLTFVKNNCRIFKLVHQKPQLFQVEKRYRQMQEKLFYPAISAYVTNEHQRIFRLEYYTRGVVAIINKWVELDCAMPIEELINLVRDCIGYTA